MTNSEANPFKIPTGLLAGRELKPVVDKTTQPELDQPRAYTASELGLTEEEFAARQAKKSIEIDVNELGQAKTVQGPVTPVPPPLATPPITVRKEEVPPPPPALYTGITLKLEPSMSDLGQNVRVIMLGMKTDGSSEEIEGSDLAILKCDPSDAGTFVAGAFIPKKEGTIKIIGGFADAGGAELYEASATLTVNAAASVQLSHSMQSVIAPPAQTVSPSAPTQLAAPAVVPPSAPKPAQNVVPNMPAVTPAQIPPTPSQIMVQNQLVPSTAQSLWRLWYVKWPLIAAAAMLAGALVVGGIGAAYHMNRALPVESALEATAPTTPVAEPERTVPEGIDPPPVAPLPPTPEPGLTGTPGTRVIMSARTAFPVSCLTGWSTPHSDDIHYMCGPNQRHGDDVCDCSVVGIAHSRH